MHGLAGDGQVDPAIDQAAPTSKDKPVCSFSWATLGINCLITDATGGGDGVHKT